MTPDPALAVSHAVVQISPESANKVFAGCLAVVDEVHDWGVRGYVLVPRPEGAAPAYVRLKWEEIELIGPVEWRLK